MSKLRKLAIISTHPIQYNVPFFRLLSRRGIIDLKVFYTWGIEASRTKFDPGFGTNIEWDIPLLEGYNYTFVENSSNAKGSHHFRGIINPSLITEITEWGAEAILFYGWSFQSHLKSIRYFAGKLPVYFRGDSISINKMFILKRILRSVFLKWVYSHVDTAFYVGSHNKTYFEKNGLNSCQLTFAPHAVDNDRFESTLIEKRSEIEKWRSSLHISSDAVVFLYAGKMDTNKNVALLADAFTSLNEKNAHLILAGEGALKDALLLKYASVGNVHFLPFHNQTMMPLLYGLSDVYVLPSLSETWGLAINEAMACGKAVIVSDSCGAATDIV
ncbi:MAG: glycosyltransferase, partial [Flavobacterium sp.]